MILTLVVAAAVELVLELAEMEVMVEIQHTLSVKMENQVKKQV